MNIRQPLTRSLSIAASLLSLSAIGCATPTPDLSDPASSLPPVAPDETEDSFGLCASDGGVLGSVATVDNRHGEVLAAHIAASGMVGIASEDQSLKFWDSRTGEQAGGVEGFDYLPAFEVDSALTAIVMTPNGETAVSGQSTGRVAAWDVASSQLLVDFAETEVPITALASDPSGELIAVADDRFGGNVTLRHLASGNVTETEESALWEVSGLEFSPDGSRLALVGHIYGAPAVASRNTAFPQADSETWEGWGLAFEHNREGARAAAWTPDGDRLVVVGDRFAAVLDGDDFSADPAPVEVLFEDHDPVGVIVSADGSWFATIGAEGGLRIVRTADGEELVSEQIGESVTLGLDPEGGRLSVVRRDGWLELLGCVAE